MVGRPFLIVLASIALSFATECPAQAQIGSDRYSAIVVDARSGAILSQDRADELRFPASLTKMMTLYVLFEALRDHRVSLNEPVPVSANAASMPPTKLGLLPGTYITVEQALWAWSPNRRMTPRRPWARCSAGMRTGSRR